MNLESLLRITHIEQYNGFDVSPDGRRATFSANHSGRWEVYELDLLTGQVAVVSTGEGGKFAPCYAPSGSALAYALDLDGSENFHIVIRSGREFHDLDAEVEHAVQPSYDWSPDSKQIVYLADKRNNFDVYIKNADGSNDRFVASVGGPAYSVKWSPDGEHLAVTAAMEGQNFGIFLVKLDGSFVRIGEPHKMDATLPAFSPDGKRVAFTSFDSGWEQIGVYDIAAQTIEWVTSGESNHNAPFWSPDGKRLGWIHARGAATKIEVQNGSGTVREIPTPPGLVHQPKFSPDGETVFFIFESPLHPPDLWAGEAATGRLTQLTHSLPADVNAADLPMPEEILYPSLDGTMIPALLYKSSNADETTPGVVAIHGGPGWHFSLLWYPVMTDMAARGWTVIAPNYRGSTGYGRDWQLSNRFEIGRLDSDDCAAAALYLINQKIADPKRIGVTGRSHGGYLTMTCLTRNPELFAAGAAVVPFLNWFTAHENSREDLQHWDIENMGDPVENEALWRERSPFFFLDRVRAPVQLICGETDPRCPPSESIEAHRKLQELGVESELHLYEGEGHAFLKIENVIDSEVKRVEFLAHALE